MNAPMLGRRALDQITPRLIAMLFALLIALTTWAARTYDASKLDVSRFVTDSVSRQSDRLILERVDQRVQAIYCAGKPAGCQ